MTKKSKEIMAILLDGKHVKFPLDYNQKEGWVLFEVPKIIKKSSLIKSGESITINGIQDQEEITWETKKEFGKVEFLYS